MPLRCSSRVSVDSGAGAVGRDHRVDGPGHGFQRRRRSRRGGHAYPCRNGAATERSRRTRTGDWEARFLTPGTYRITFELTGFRTLRREGITVSTAEMATVNVTLEVGALAEAVEVTAQRGNGVVGSMTVVAHAGSERARCAADVGAQLHAAAGHRAGRVGRHQRAALERQRVDFAERQRRADHQQQLRLQRRRRHQPALLQQPGQRVERHDRQRRRSLSRNVAPAPETLQEVKLQTSLYDAGHRAQRRRQLHAGLEERHEQLPWHRLLLQPERRPDGQRLLLQPGRYRKADPAAATKAGGTIGGPILQEQDVLLRVVPAHAGRDLLRGRGEQYRAAAEGPHRRSVATPASTASRRPSGIPSTARSTSTSINPISRALLKATFPDGTYLIPSGRQRASTAGGAAAQLFESCQVVSVIPATFEQDQFTTNLDHQVTHSEPAQREVLLLEPAEPGSAGQRQRADALRARGHDLPADVLAHRPAHLQPDGPERVPRGLLPQPQRQRSRCAYFTNAAVRDRRTPSTPWSRTSRQLDIRRRP